MKPAEFTDYASAAAFLAAGRKKGERSTSDGWNTVLYDRGHGELTLELHGSPIVRYFPGGEKVIEIPMRTHVVADRVQRYGFASDFQLVPAKGAWSISARWNEVPGVNGLVPIMFPIVADAPSRIEIAPSGNMVAPIPAPTPTVLSRSQRKQIFDPLVKKWLAKVMKQLDAGWEFTDAQLQMCGSCMPHMESFTGAWAGDMSHLYAHVLEEVTPPAFVTSTLNRSSHLVDLKLKAGGGRMGGPGMHRTYVRRLLRSNIQSLTY